MKLVQDSRNLQTTLAMLSQTKVWTPEPSNSDLTDAIPFRDSIRLNNHEFDGCYPFSVRDSSPDIFIRTVFGFSICRNQKKDLQGFENLEGLKLSITYRK